MMLVLSSLKQLNIAASAILNELQNYNPKLIEDKVKQQINKKKNKIKNKLKGLLN